MIFVMSNIPIPSSCLLYTSMKDSAPVANYTNELMATRFSDVMWLIEQIMWKSLDKRCLLYTSTEAVRSLSPVIMTTFDMPAFFNEVTTAAASSRRGS